MLTNLCEKSGCITIGANRAYNITTKRTETVWSHWDWSSGQQVRVGPWYKTKAELLADHARYMVAAGWISEAY